MRRKDFPLLRDRAEEINYWIRVLAAMSLTPDLAGRMLYHMGLALKAKSEAEKGVEHGVVEPVTETAEESLDDVLESEDSQPEQDSSARLEECSVSESNDEDGLVFDGLLGVA